MKVKTDKNLLLCGHGSGTPATKNMHDYCESRYKTKATNGKDKGVVCVRRFKGLKKLLKRLAFVRTYKTILGRNEYSQEKRDYVYEPYYTGKYYSDCSSSGMATLVKIGFKLPWLFNTAAIMTSDLFEDVQVTIKNGHIMNPEVLKYGDCIMFRGNDPSRPQQVGHVEYIYKKSK